MAEIQYAIQLEVSQLIAERALLVRRLERIQTVMRRDPCHEECPPEYDAGDPGIARCDLTDPADYICPGCLVRVAELDVIRPRLRTARRRLRYALDQIDRR